MGDRKSHQSRPPRASSGREKGTISIHFVRAVVDAVGRRGLDAEMVLREAGISAGLLAIPQARVSAQHYSALWRLVIRLLDDEFFGLDSRRMKAGSFALLTLSVVHCTNLRATLDRTARLLSVFLDDFRVLIDEAHDTAAVRIVERLPGTGPAVFAHETLLVMVYGLACWLVGRRIPLLRAEFAYLRPAHAEEYTDLFGTSLSFARPFTALAFDARALALPVVQSEVTAKDFLRIAPENILLRYKNTEGLAARIRRRLRQATPDAWPDLESVAQELNVAPATLRRRLRAEGQSFQAIKDALRRDLAITYLSASQMSIGEIASELGFVEPSAFHRAFRKWAHTSPGAYRQSHRIPDEAPRATLATAERRTPRA